MTRTLLHIVGTSFFVTLGGCAERPDRLGTQIGFEEELRCELVSSETLTDLLAIPDGLARSPRDVIDGLAGAFRGPQLEEEEESGDQPLEPSDGQAWLTVVDPGGPVTLEHFEGVSHTDGGDVSHLCPPTYTFDLEVILAADGLPTFQSTLSVVHSDEAWAESHDETSFDAELPAPATFDPDDFDRVESYVRLSSFEGDWWAYVGWEASNPDEAAPDGDLTITAETLLMAALEVD